MSGKLCFGSAYNNAGAGHLSASKAFCEGVNHRASGTALEAPTTDNPHPAGSPDWDSWDAGWTAANAATGQAFPNNTCCAPTQVILA